ncbi:lysozyme inhibitor LprI family protein [Ferruginibacter sp.]
MKLTAILLLFFILPFCCSAQQSLVDVYKAKEFPCDSESGTIAINFCTSTKAEFADSLLNVVYRKLLSSINKDIAADKKSLNQETAKGKKADSLQLQMYRKNIDLNQRLKKSIIYSQQQWIKLRDANVDVASIECEGGTGCIAMTNQAYIDETLERIQKLESFLF